MRTHFTKIFAFILTFMLVSCERYEEYFQKPELQSLRHGVRTAATIGYCASIATSAFKGEPLPENVEFNESAGLIYVEISEDYPLPFTNTTGDLVMSVIWNNGSGVMSILFGDLDILGGEAKLYGIYMIPFQERDDDGILTIMAEQDVILGRGSDTILDLSNVTVSMFNAELERLDSTPPSDLFVAVEQNVWHIKIDQSQTLAYVYDDYIKVTGGGQIAEVEGSSGGVIYHALLETIINYSVCPENPISGSALSQNFKAGGTPYIDLGNSYLEFHETCDGMAYVKWSSGIYRDYREEYISLDL